MSTPWRAWRFAHPDLDPVAGGLALSDRGGVAMVDGEAAVRQAILLLLSTRRGERVMRPEYGCDLHRLMFMPNDRTTAGLAMHYVRRALQQWEPRIEVLALTVVPGAAERLDIQLDYRIRSTGRSASLALALPLGAH